ncbi:MAG: DUF4129 domain-containing protein [Chloroflexota bacterium]
MAVGRSSLTAGTGQPVLVYPLLGFAVLRGAAQGGDPSAGAAPIETLVRRAPWLLGAGWIAGFVAAGGEQAAFLPEAATCTLAFIVAAALAMGTGRLAALPQDDREQLRGNGSWLMVVVAIVGAALLVSVLTAGVLGGPLRGLPTGIAQLALSAVGVVIGAVLSVVVVLIDAVMTLLGNLFHFTPPKPPTPPPGYSGSQGPVMPPIPDGNDQTFETILGVLLIVAVVLVAWYLARRWQGARRAVVAPSSVPETRSISLDARGALPPLRLGARLRERFAPSGALGAYPRLLHDWAAHPEVARAEAETPAEHAARLRSAGQGGLALDLLAADYELAAFGEVTLTPAEERRAVRRWRRLRRRRRPE